MRIKRTDGTIAYDAPSAATKRDAVTAAVAAGACLTRANLKGVDLEEAYAEEYIGDTGMLDSIPENLRHYLDVKKFARDLFMSDMHSVRSGHGTVYVFERNV